MVPKAQRWEDYGWHSRTNSFRSASHSRIQKSTCNFVFSAYFVTTAVSMVVSSADTSKLCHFEILIYKELALTIVPLVQGWVGFCFSPSPHSKNTLSKTDFRTDFRSILNLILKLHSFNSYIHSFKTYVLSICSLVEVLLGIRDPVGNKTMILVLTFWWKRKLIKQ